MKLAGLATNFIYVETLYDINTGLQGFIGILHSRKTIYIVLRGISTIINWDNDDKVFYDSYPECNCYVHNGFYKSALSIKNITLYTIVDLIDKYYNYDIIVTSHSYGAGISQLLSMEIKKIGIDVKLYNFEQPYVGDSKYTSLVNTNIKEYFRITYRKEIIPRKMLEYYHSCKEFGKNNFIKLCGEYNCEESNCNNQYKVYQDNSLDFGLSCNAVFCN